MNALFRSLLVALLAVPIGCSTPPQEASEDRALQDLFPPYSLNFRPVGSSTQSGNLPGNGVLEQVELSYPSHSSFQLQHELVERNEDPLRVMKLLDLQAGHTVADIGCGSGFYTVPFVRLVGAHGKVWALDIQQAAVDFLQERLQQDPSLDPHGVVAIEVNAPEDMGLAVGSVDRALFSHANFYAYRPMLDENHAMLRSVQRAMAPDGKLVVVQYMGIDQGLGMSAHNIRDNFGDAGLVVETEQFQPEANVWYFVFAQPSGD